MTTHTKRALLGCIADDFTGATDVASMLVRAGLRQFFGDEPDLQVGAISVSNPNPQSGETITVTWTVSNNGTRATRQNSWFDGIYLSNDASLDPSDLPLCSSYPDWYCPATTKSLTSTTIGAYGTPSLTVPFTVGKFTSLAYSSNNVFGEIAGNSSFGFDWGLPFFMGRNVFVGFEGKTGLGNTGPFVAY